jgi:predicted secreted Zn-dependent protease
MVARRRIRQPFALLLLLLLPLVLARCAGLRSGAPEWVTLRISTSTEYYVVRGTTSRAIFEALDGNGLSDSQGRRAVGLTSALWSLEGSGVQEGVGFCSAASMTIVLDLVVTLPRLDASDGLSPDLEAKWQRFAARVAAHEQRHVDIYLEGARRMKTRMETALAKPSTCAAMQAAIGHIWASEQAETEASQERFHVEDDARFEVDRRPLQARIETNKARLTAIEAEAEVADRALEEVASEISAASARMALAEAELAQAADGPFDCTQPTPRLHLLCQQRDGVVILHRGLGDRYNALAAHKRTLVEEYAGLVRATNDLIEVRKWTR